MQGLDLRVPFLAGTAQPIIPCAVYDKLQLQAGAFISNEAGVLAVNRVRQCLLRLGAVWNWDRSDPGSILNDHR